MLAFCATKLAHATGFGSEPARDSSTKRVWKSKMFALRWDASRHGGNRESHHQMWQGKERSKH